MTCARGGLERDDDPVLGDRDAGGCGDALRLLLVHGERRGEHAGMRVGDVEDLQQALDRAVLAEGAVQGVEDDVRPELRQHLRDVAADIDRA